MKPRDEGKANARTTNVAVVLVVEAGFAVVGVWFHDGMTAEYGDVTELAEGRRAGVSSIVEFGGLALFLVLAAAVVVVFVTAQRWARRTAVAIPVLMVVGLIAVTPAALREKLVSSYSDTPQCVFRSSWGPGPAWMRTASPRRPSSPSSTSGTSVAGAEVVSSVVTGGSC